MFDNFLFWCLAVIGITFLAIFVVLRKKEGYTKFLPLYLALLFFFSAASVHFYERFHDSSWWIPVGDLCILVILFYGFWIFLSKVVENNQEKYKVESGHENDDSAKEKLDLTTDEHPAIDGSIEEKQAEIKRVKELRDELSKKIPSGPEIPTGTDIVRGQRDSRFPKI